METETKRKVSQPNVDVLPTKIPPIIKKDGCFAAIVTTLALLPAPLVYPAFNSILRNIPLVENANNQQLLIDFRNYFENTWLNGRFPITLWNHWENNGPRTTNHAEGYHNRLNLVEVRDMNLAVRNFLHLLQPMHNRDQIRVRNLQRMVYQPRPRDETYVELDRRMMMAKDRFLNATDHLWNYPAFNAELMNPHEFQYLMNEIHQYLRYIRHLYLSDMPILYDYNISSWSDTAVVGYHSRQLQNYSSSSSLYKISRLSILSVLNLAVVLENSFVILAIVSNRRLRNSNNNLLILSLAVADLLLGIFVLPVSNFDSSDEQQSSIDNRRYLRDETDRFWCAFWQLLDFWLRTASIYSLVVITIDRFLAISFPLKYKVIMNRNAIFIVSLMVWAVSILISLPLLIISRKESSVYKFEYSKFCDRKIITDKIYAVFYATMSFYVPFLVILIFYSKIYCRIRRVRKSIMEGFLNVERPPTPKRKQTMPWTAAMAAENEASHSQREAEGLQGASGRSASVAGQAPPNRQTRESPHDVKSQDTLRVHAGGYSRRVNTYNRAPVHLSSFEILSNAINVSTIPNLTLLSCREYGFDYGKQIC
uniref:G-protein coupled receptors family 1 profile domain-containing protein n=1 Tax=Romanomermis culicivorax TaxID=13658 RepID=A0A915IKG3_ROMCU